MWVSMHLHVIQQKKIWKSIKNTQNMRITRIYINACEVTRVNVWPHWFCVPKISKYSDTQKICCNHSKIWTMWLYHRVMSPSDADRMANSVDPDQTAPLGAVWSWSALFAQAYLFENLGSLRYVWTYADCSAGNLTFLLNLTWFCCRG